MSGAGVKQLNRMVKWARWAAAPVVAAGEDDAVPYDYGAPFRALHPEVLTRTINRNGYVEVLPAKGDAFARATKTGGRVLEHRLVMARHLGRPLKRGENVHHKNGVRHDNRLANLELWTRPQPTGVRLSDLADHAREVLRRFEELSNA